jgi:hypothetical protein
MEMAPASCRSRIHEQVNEKTSRGSILEKARTQSIRLYSPLQKVMKSERWLEYFASVGLVPARAIETSKKGDMWGVPNRDEPSLVIVSGN